MRTLGTGRIRRINEGVAYSPAGTGLGVKNICLWHYATNDAAAAVEAAGFFNSMANDLPVGSIIFASLDLDGTPTAKQYVVTANTGTVVTVAAF